MQIVCMKSQILFPWKNKKNIFNLSSAELAKRMITVNNDNIANSSFFFFFFFFFFNSTEIRVPSLSLIHLHLYILLLRYAKDPNCFSAKRVLMLYANNNGPGRPAHMCDLIGAHCVRPYSPMILSAKSEDNDHTVWMSRLNAGLQWLINWYMVGITTIIKWGIWQPVKFQLVSPSWTGSKMKCFF